MSISRSRHCNVGTGCYRDCYITRVYVSSKYQGKGYSSYIMDCLEAILFEKYSKSIYFKD